MAKEVKQKYFERTSMGSTNFHSKSAGYPLKHRAVFTPREWPHMTSFGQPGQAAYISSLIYFTYFAHLLTFITDSLRHSDAKRCVNESDMGTGYAAVSSRYPESIYL
ncbi:hypothetical protein CEXT_786601 [Caerostris extrusa]|uniref:Uncharacterized protein n=1 Tax=Caerostris extrusa TaxID=172846 RepID=A0AAV4QP77_CAEEX|nr:hypothetical protein CEXT_786601 [Caerostris extrusa]